MQGARKLNPIGLRVPDLLRECIRVKAVQNRRSLNSEIIYTLEKTYGSDQTNTLSDETSAV